MSRMRWIGLNAVLGSLVVTVGLWLVWGGLPLAITTMMGLAIAGFLAWFSPTISAVWAWATLLLGVESLTWPVLTMIQARMASAEPTEQQMGLILTAVLFGVFSSVFWLTFSYGLFRRLRSGEKGKSA